MPVELKGNQAGRAIKRATKFLYSKRIIQLTPHSTILC